MAKLIVIYWRDIPSQVVAKRGRVSEKVKLSHRFQAAIDRAAMRAGKGGSDLYVAEWRREISSCTGELVEVARSTAKELESRYSDEDLKALVKAKGLAASVLSPG